MIRSLLLLIALPLSLANAADNDAEKLFREVEKNVHAAKTLQSRFEVKSGEAKLEGTLSLGEADAMRMDSKGSLGVVRFIPPSLIGDGTKLAVVSQADTDKAKVVKTGDSPKDLGKALRGMMTRPGVLLEFSTAVAGKAPAEDAATFHLTDFKLGAKEKVGDIETQVIEYTVAVKGKTITIWLGAAEQTLALKGTEKATAKLWVDPKTNLPVKMEARADLDGKVIDFSQSFTVNGKLDAKLFAVPK